VNGDRTAKGRFAPGNQAARVAKAKQAPGSTGVIAYGGWVQTGDPSSLSGTRKWVEYANAFSRPPVAIALLLRSALLSGAKWSLHENAAGGKGAKQGVDVIQQGLLDADLDEPWNEVVARAAMSYFHGASIHAFSLARRPDGLVAVNELGHRPMSTILRWLRAADNMPFDSVEQQTPDGKLWPIPLSECLYIREGVMSDSPEGVGVLRLIVERIRRIHKYEALEGSEMFSSMGGLPIARAPLEEIRNDVKGLPADKQEAEIDRRTDALETAVKNRIKTPEKQQYLLLDSATFKGADPNEITTVPKWALEIVKGDLQGLADIRKTINDLDLDLARILGVEFAYVGGGSSSGTYGMHESKVGVFQASLQSGLNRIAQRAMRQLVRPIIKANGLDPDTCSPTLVPEKITISAVLEATQALANMTLAGLRPDDPARNVIRERLDLPPEPDPAPALMLPRGRVPADPNAPKPEDIPPADPEPMPDVTEKRRKRR
jgi:hypothetical protein